MKKMLIIMLCFTMVITSLAGCGANSKDDTSAQSDGTVETSAKRDDLVVAYSNKSSSLDTYNNNPSDIQLLVLDTLVGYSSEENKLTPKLAESWERSDDGLVWTFKLRDDVYFQDGTKLTANDVAYSFDQLKAGTFAPQYPDYTAEVIDDTTIKISTTKYLVGDELKFSYICIVNSAMYKELGAVAYFEKLNGSGPYVLDSYDSTTGMAVLVRNEKYWGELPKLKKITFRYIPDVSTIATALANGEVDFAKTSASVYSTLENNPDIETKFSDPTSLNYIIFNTQQYPTSELKFRQAICYAIDNKTIAEAAEIPGNYEVLSSFYTALWGDKPEGLTEYEYNPEKAKELLAELGIETPYDLGTVPIMDNQKVMLELVQQYLADVGITIKFEQLDESAYFEAMDGGNFKLGAMSGIVADAGKIILLDMFLNSKNIGGSGNYASLSDPKMDALIETMNKSLTEEEASKAEGNVMVSESQIAAYDFVYNSGVLYSYRKGLNIHIKNRKDIRNSYLTAYWN
jgi:peptide/nickel transport system substrate-binding protein